MAEGVFGGYYRGNRATLKAKWGGLGLDCGEYMLC